jgi:O-antigen biosynthesis protein
MAKVAIVSYDVQTVAGKAGGVASFTTRWARLLRQAGESVSICMTTLDYEPKRVETNWRAIYEADGIGLIEVQAPPASETRWPEIPTLRLSEVAAPILSGFDIVYVQDWGNALFHLVRQRRFSQAPSPVCVTVLHGPSEWELSSNGVYPKLPDDLHLAYLERYAAKHSDFVTSPSHYMLRHLSSIGWEFPGEVPVLGLPMTEPKAATEKLLPGPIQKIVCFARIEERKGIRNFALALQQIAGQLPQKPEVVLLGSIRDSELHHFATKTLQSAGYPVSSQSSLDSEAALRYLGQDAARTLCVVPSPSDNHPYTVVEASLIPGLNLLVCEGGGVPEILAGAGRQISAPFPAALGAKILERLRQPLPPEELKAYDWRAANQKWLGFHERALQARNSARPIAFPAQTASVDVCVTYYQKPAVFPQLIDALEKQTVSDFHVIAVNDGSPDEESNRVFDEQAARVAPRDWDFFCQPNAFVDAARNRAASRGSGELILFIDGDDVPAPNTVERLREAIQLSGDDAIIPANYMFASQSRPVDPESGEILVPDCAKNIPLGMDLTGGLVNPCAFGGSMFMLRRKAFEAIGGYTEIRGAGHEDWELYVRLALAGFKLDVLPEFLQFYRQTDGSLARTLPSQASRRRLLGAYEEKLQQIGFRGAASTLSALHFRANQLEGEVRQLRIKADMTTKRLAFFSPQEGWMATHPDGWLQQLRTFYRNKVSLEARLKFHRTFLTPFFGPPRMRD